MTSSNVWNVESSRFGDIQSTDIKSEIESTEIEYCRSSSTAAADAFPGLAKPRNNVEQPIQIVVIGLGFGLYHGPLV